MSGAALLGHLNGCDRCDTHLCDEGAALLRAEVAEQDASLAPAVFHLERSFLQVLDDGVYVHVEDDHYSGKLAAVDALALAHSILALVKETRP